MKAIYLVGFMGAGKSTLAKKLAEELSGIAYDTDQEIEKATGMSVKEIFADKGEKDFRVLESDVLKEIPTDNVIVATGGGMVLAEQNQRLMKEQGTVIFLYADPLEILKRLEGDDSRPLLQNNNLEVAHSLYSNRLPLYRQSAHFEIDTTSKTVMELVAEIRQRMKQ
jgi:shikimate kinase